MTSLVRSDVVAYLDQQRRCARHNISLPASVNNHPAIQSCDLRRYLLLCGRRRGRIKQTTPNKLIISKSLGNEVPQGKQNNNDNNTNYRYIIIVESRSTLIHVHSWFKRLEILIVISINKLESESNESIHTGFQV